ncbi:MAG: hypothetical protein ABSC13_08095 [Dehalococcoidia bacterium]|jgi:hypothetical protein
MITADQIRHTVISDAEDLKKAEELKRRFAGLSVERRPFFLKKDDLEEILKWKLRGQFGRQRALRKGNTDEIIHDVTLLAFSIELSDEEYELEIRLAILCSLRGVGVPVASAVLALVFPEQYSVIDFRGWRRVFEEDKRTFSIGDYRRYLAEIRGLAAKLGWPVQQVGPSHLELRQTARSADPRGTEIAQPLVNRRGCSRTASAIDLIVL